jgi:hypothetical protein
MRHAYQPAIIRFIDEFAPDTGSLEAAAETLAEGRPAKVQWPQRTGSLLARQEAGRETIVARLAAVGGQDPSPYHVWLGQAQRYAATADRFPMLWRGLSAIDAP